MLDVFCFKWKPAGKRRIPSQDIVTYGAEHVNKLYWMLNRNTTTPFRFTCVTDEFDDNIHGGVRQLILWNEFRELGGCYPRLKMYDDAPEFQRYIGADRFVCMDLDVVIVGNIDHILNRKEDFVYYRMPGPDGTGYRFNCGMWMMDFGARPHVYSKFRNNPEFWIEAAKHTTPGSDQAWCNYILDLNREAYWDRRNDGIYDMRQDFIEGGRNNLLPEDARIVMWPGPRDPSQSEWVSKYGHSWIKEHWREGV